MGGEEEVPDEDGEDGEEDGEDGGEEEEGETH